MTDPAVHPRRAPNVVDFKNVTKKFGDLTDHSRRDVQRRRPARERRVHRDPRPVGLRQVHRAAADRRPAAAISRPAGHGAGRRQTGQRPRPRSRHGVPGLHVVRQPLGEDNVAFGLECRGMAAKERLDRAREWIPARRPRRRSSCACSTRRARPRSSGSSCPNIPTRFGTAICPDARPGTLYGYRVHGPYEPEARPPLQPEQAPARPVREGHVGELLGSGLFGYKVERGRRPDVRRARQRALHAEMPRGRSGLHVGPRPPRRACRGTGR